jgi:hypothetical protein
MRLRLWPEWLTLAFYITLIAATIPAYRPWADEAQAWQMAGYASLKDIFLIHLRHEGHPGLWYVLLYLCRHVHLSYIGLHWATGALAVIAASLVIFRSPFPFIVRATLPFTFFLAFQYAIVARSYVLIPLLLFATALTWKRDSAIPTAVLLGLLANVELHAAAISFGFAVVYALELRSGARHPRHRYGALAIFITLFAIAALTVLPLPADTLGPGLDEQSSPAIIASLWVVKSIVFTSRGLISFPWYLGLATLLLLAWAIRGSVWARYSIPLLTLAAFSGFFFQFWHLGLVLVTGVAICWILWPIPWKSKTHRIAARLAVSLTIATQLLYTAYAVVYEHRNPYSPDLAASRYLAPFVAAHTPIAVGYVKNIKVRAFDSVGLRPYLNGPIFLNEPDPFWRWVETLHTRAAFQSALQEHPAIVLVEYYDSNFKPFDLQRESSSRTIEQVQQSGYLLTHTFCGSKPQDLREQEHICHLIFEPAAVQTTR